MYFNFQLHYQVLQEQVKDRMLQNQTREKIYETQPPATNSWTHC